MKPSPAPAGLAPVLCEIDPQQAQWTQALARALRSAGFEVRVESAHGEEPGWYLGETCAFRPAPGDAAPVGAPAERLVEVLAQHEPLLADIEAASGLAAEFTQYGPLGRDCASIALRSKGEERGAIAALANPPRATVPIQLEPQSLRCTIARLAMAEAEALGPGDMVIAFAGPWALAGMSDAPGAARASFDPATGAIRTGLYTTSSGENRLAEQNDNPGLAVPVTISLPDTVLSGAELEALAAGGTVTLGPVAEGLTVSLAVGGRAIGQGELVRLGDRFAVLLEGPAGFDPPPPDEPAPSGGNGGGNTPGQGDGD